MMVINKPSFIIKIIVVLLTWLFFFSFCMPYKSDDIYEINGVCADVRMKSQTLFRGGSTTTRIIEINDGKEYVVSKKMLKQIGIDKDNITELECLIGENVFFFAVDKKYSLSENRVLLEWKSEEINSNNIVEVVNKTQDKSRVIAFFVSAFISLCFFIPEILRALVKRDEKKRLQIIEHNRKKEKEKKRKRKL